MTAKISTIYEEHISKCETFKEGLEALFHTIDKIKHAEIRVDIDQVNLNRAMEFRIREIETEM
jgi:hypothetical protein